MRRRVSFASTLAVLLGAALPALAGPESAHHSRGTAGVFWFIQVSDSHIGALAVEGPNATPHFEYALNEAVAAIDPSFVVATGDLVDGSRILPAAGQTQAEWDDYRAIVDGAGMTTDFFFDLPGNHDGYDDIGMTFYLANSLQGQASGSLFHDWVVTTPVGEYYFFGLNSAGDGSIPFIANPVFTTDEITALENGLQAHSTAELSFVLAHHPLALPTNSAQVVDAMMTADVGYYLHGHEHAYEEYFEGNNTIVVNQIDSLGKGNVNNLGVGVIDHNGFAYRARDIVAPWPFVIITAPLNRTLRGTSSDHPYAYDVCLGRTDNPFRAVVFAEQAPSEVNVAVGTLAQTPMSLVSGSGSLWEAEVDTTTLAPGPHDVTVSAVVGGDVGQQTISAVFVPGTCAELPDSDIPTGGAGGAGGAAGAGGGTGGFGGGAGGAAGGFGGAGGGAVPGTSPELDDEGGCGCRQVGPPSGGSLPMGLWVALALGVVAGARRRRGQQRVTT